MALTRLLYSLRDDTFFRVCCRFGVTPVGTIGHPEAVAAAGAQLVKKGATLRSVLEELTNAELVLAKRILFNGDHRTLNSPDALTGTDRRELIEMIAQRMDPLAARR